MFTLPEPLVACLHQQAARILRRAHLDEPVCWEPPFEWAGDVAWPGPHPDDIDTERLWALRRYGLTRATIAARLHTTVEHVHLATCRHPVPAQKPPTRSASPVMLDDHSPTAEQLRDYVRRGFGPRTIARVTGCGYGVITQLLAADGLTQPAPRDILATVDLAWLRHEYDIKRRSIKDIAIGLGVPASDLATHARAHSVTPRHGVTSRPHVLARHGGPAAFSTLAWTTFARYGAEQRVRRFLAIPGHPSIKHAAKHLGIRKDLLARQVRDLEHTVGTPLLHPTPAGLALTDTGTQFVREVHPILDLLGPVPHSAVPHPDNGVLPGH